MTPLYVFEDSQVDRLYPLTYSRAACELRVGTLTLLERLRLNLGQAVAGMFVRPAVAEVVRGRVELPINPSVSTTEGILLVNGRWLLLQGDGAWQLPAVDTVGLSQSTVVWMHLSAGTARELDFGKLHEARTLEAVLPRVQRQRSAARLIDRPWDVLEHQRAAIVEDFARLGPANHGALMPGVHLLEEKQIYLGRGVKVWPGVVMDAQGGPIIVEEGTEVRANAVITGPTSIGPRCVVRTAAEIREDCSFGAGSKVGGEIANTVFLGNANKQHHGFLGQTIVGEWANLGAGTTTSNLKNTYGAVSVPMNGVEISTGRQFMGSVIGDHAKLGIGTYLSTGSVVGFGSHVVVGRPPRFVPSFAWLTEKGMARANFEKLEEIAGIAMQRRGGAFTAADHELWVRIASEMAVGEQYAWGDE